MPEKKKGKLEVQYKLGNGIPLIFIHGFCETLHVWEEMISKLDEPIYALNLPGIGESPQPKSYDIDTIVEIIHMHIRGLKLERYILIGHSMGGYIAAAYADKYKNHAFGYGLIHSIAGSDSEEKKLYRDKSIDFIKKNGAEPFINSTIKSLFKAEGLTNMFVNQIDIDAHTYYDEEQLFGYIKMMRDRPDRVASLRKEHIPFLYVLGNYDSVLEKEKILKEIAEMPLTQVKILKLSSHMAMYEETNKLYKTIRTFVHFCENIRQREEFDITQTH